MAKKSQRSTKIRGASESNNQMRNEAHLSFSGGGFLGIYHVGVLQAFKDFAPEISAHRVLGASSGALAASCLVCDLPVHGAIDTITRMTVHCRSSLLGPMHPSFNVADILRKGLADHLPADAHLRSAGRLLVSVTRASTMTNELVSRFDSREELIEVLMASCFIPYFLGMVPPKIRGVYYIDGGLTCNMPEVNKFTITVTPFLDQQALIKPRWELAPDVSCFPFVSFRLWKSMFSPSPQTLVALCQQGYEDAVHFLQMRNMLTCLRCTMKKRKRVSARRKGKTRPTPDCSKCKATALQAGSSGVSREFLQPMIEAAVAESKHRELHPVISTTAVQLLLSLLSILIFPITALIVFTHNLTVFLNKRLKLVGHARQVAAQRESNSESQGYKRSRSSSANLTYSHC